MDLKEENEKLLKEVEALRNEINKIKISEKKGKDYSKVKYVAKTAYGMKDYGPEECKVREEVIQKISNVFKLHGAVSIETPVVELKATLTGKYGEDAEAGNEDEKLIYDLKDQGGELLSLRYDLTVPFARYCGQNNVEAIKRYAMAKVYRRDRPNMAKGRYREFYQCDLDIAGQYERMTADAECIAVLCEILGQFDIEFLVKINHRELLDGIFATAEVQQELFRTVCSSVDKLDKLPWEDVKKELMEKGLEDSQAEKIWKYAQIFGKGNVAANELLDKLLSDEELCTNCGEGVKDLKLMMEYCEALGVNLDRIEINLSLARGLDYYTGIIYEAGCLDQTGTGVGSIAGGGRYDNLIGSFRRKNKVVPCVGVSVGIERLFAILQSKKNEKGRKNDTEVLVCVVGVGKDQRKEFLKQRMKWLNTLWTAGIKAETLWKMNPKPLTQFQVAEDQKIRVALVLGPRELEEGKVKVRNVETREEELVSTDAAIEKIKSILG
eukprot:snap_masked-scaffold_10-processed-gene-4.30-mRNA-1 protein AED:0.03 eAED:0.03 QI:0/-1/0/1/-1/1/1/0/494